MKLYLYVLDNALVCKISPCAVSCRGKTIGRNVQEGTIAIIGDVQSSHRNCAVSNDHLGRILKDTYSASGRANIKGLPHRPCY